MDIPLPDWLTNQPNQQSESSSPVGHVATAITSFPSNISQMSSEMRALEQQTFGIAFESALEHVAGGSTLESFCREYHVRLNPARFRAWVNRNTVRRQTFDVARAIGMEAMEEDIIRISDGLNADGTASLNEVQRSVLMVSTRKWIMAANNRRKYGETKFVEQTTTTRIDPSTLSTEQLERRLVEKLGLDGNVFDALDAEFSARDDAA